MDSCIHINSGGEHGSMLDGALLSGRDLRYFLTLRLFEVGDHSVLELAAAVADAGFVVAGRPSKEFTWSGPR